MHKSVLTPAQILPLGKKIMLFLNDSRLLELQIAFLCASIKSAIISFKEGNRVEMKVLYLVYVKERLSDLKKVSLIVVINVTINKSYCPSLDFS